MALVYWGQVAAATDKTMAAVVNSTGSETRVAIQAYITQVAAGVISGNTTIIAAAEAALADAMSMWGVSIDYNSSQYTFAHRDAAGVFSQLRIRASDGKFPDDVVDDFAVRMGFVPGGDSSGNASARGLAAFPILTARASKSKADATPVALVYVGSSTTANHGVDAADGYVSILHKAIQARWPSGGTESTVRVNASADFDRITTAGVHGYNAGQGGTNASTYLTNAECDKIAALFPAAMIHMVGSNDYKAQDDPSVYRNRVASRLAYLDSVLTEPCQHILVQPYQRTDFTPSTYPWAAYATALREVAAGRQNTKVVDISGAFSAVGIPGADPLGIMSSDNVHMVERGYRFMADLLIDAIIS